MTEPDVITAFVNGATVSLARGATALDAVRAHDAAVADAVVAGDRAMTDSRGLPVAVDSLATGGAVYRIVSARSLREQDAS
ncbi:MAG: hypothetical protein NTZ43_02720 [Gemmatimonadetes bacterium]|nr:hypothetical protein [Gemmatimonadota bacterium]